MKQQVINGNNIDLLKNYHDNYFDAIVTDPPYGLGKEPNAEELMKDWIEKGYHEIKGLGFMGKEWDAFVPQPIFWKEVFRVLKPGGHILAFYGTRTYDWGVMAMRFAGFEVRDCIQWLYGSGFPKSHNISKQFDKRGGNNHLVDEVSQKLKEARESRGISKGEADKLFCDGTTNYMWFEGRKDGVRLPDNVSFEKICNEWSELKPYQDKIRSANREIVGNYDGDMGGLGGERLGNSGGDITISATDVAKQWEGWGTALKPANEPIVLARKPLEKGLSIAENILKWGVGGINIDASRIGFSQDDPNLRPNSPNHKFNEDNSGFNMHNSDSTRATQDLGFHNSQGRFPANIILTHHEDCECKGTKKVNASGGGQANHIGKDINNTILGKGYKRGEGLPYGDENGQEEVENWDCHEDCPIRILDEQSGVRKSGIAVKRNLDGRTYNENQNWGLKAQKREDFGYTDKGGASRFFYVAKASKAERNKGLKDFEEKIMEGRDEGQDERSVAFKARPTPMANIHPTVKPIKLMQYLVKMVTPPNGIILDPFCGSGTTGVACKIEGFNFIGLEQDAEYSKIAEARINNYKLEPKQIDIF